MDIADNERMAVPLSIERGQPRIVTSSYFIQEVSKSELAMPKRLYTFDNMMLDDAVNTSAMFTNILVKIGLYRGQFEVENDKYQYYADFLNYCIRNMSSGTWLEFINSLVTDIIYGFSLHNIVAERKQTGKYRNKLVLKKIAPRDQKSVYGWIWDKNFREVLGFVQKPMLKTHEYHANSFNNGISELQLGRYYTGDYPVLFNNQIVHSKYNAKNNNPQGDSPLLHCYQAWKEKVLIQRYELIGVTRDFAGLPVLRVPSALIKRANQPDLYPDEYREYNALQRDAAALHAGENAFIVLTSDTDEVSKKYLYDITLQGIEGSSGKQYKSSDIIDQKRKSIYNTFGTGFLLLGQDSVGSYNLSTTGQNVHSFFVEDNLIQKSEVITQQIGKRLLEVNGINITWEDMPKYRYKDPDSLSYDEVGKLIQRMQSVKCLTPKALEVIYKQAGLPIDGIEDIDFTDKGESRSGESFGTSGTGSITSDRDISVANNENTMETKSFVLDKDFIVEDK